MALACLRDAEVIELSRLQSVECDDKKGDIRHFAQGVMMTMSLRPHGVPSMTGTVVSKNSLPCSFEIWHECTSWNIIRIMTRVTSTALTATR